MTRTRTHDKDTGQGLGHMSRTMTHDKDTGQGHMTRTRTRAQDKDIDGKGQVKRQDQSRISNYNELFESMLKCLSLNLS